MWDLKIHTSYTNTTVRVGIQSQHKRLGACTGCPVWRHSNIYAFKQSAYMLQILKYRVASITLLKKTVFVLYQANEVPYQILCIITSISLALFSCTKWQKFWEHQDARSMNSQSSKASGRITKRFTDVKHYVMIIHWLQLRKKSVACVTR